jgi:2-hydroxychromene-2-carboxylate isomerase
VELVFYFDVVCPYAYLASRHIEGLAARAGVRLTLEPVLLGGIFRAIGAPDAPPLVPPKARLNALDLARWAALDGTPLSFPPPGHPRRSVDAMRLLHAAPVDDRARLMHALYRAYFVEHRDIADRALLTDVAGAALVARIDEPAVKDSLRAATDRAVADGVFGVPGMVVVADDGTRTLVWGRDRLAFVEAALARRPVAVEDLIPPASAPAPAGTRLTFFYDLSSPFAYLGATQIDRLASSRGLRARWRPMLLGALFKAIGTPDVPLMTFSPPKQRYYGRDLTAWAAAWGQPFAWPTRFPMRTVLALRTILALPDEDQPRAALRLFRAYWAEDRDLADPSVIAAALDELALPREALARAEAGDAALKEALRASTAEAIAAGVCGAPSILVERPGKEPQLFWGQDRLGLVAHALDGRLAI